MKAAIVGLLASAFLVSVGARTAHAQKPKKVVVEQFSGVAADKFRRIVVAALVNQGIEVVSDKKRAATEADLGLLQVSDNYAAVAKELGAGAFIDGSVTGRRHLTARLKVKGPDGSPMGGASWMGANERKLLNTIDDTAAKKLASVLAGGGGGAAAAKEDAEVAEAPAAKAAAKEEVAEETPPPTKGRRKKAAPPPEEAGEEGGSEKPSKARDDETTVAEEADEPGSSAPFKRLDLQIGAHVYGRNFSYNDSRQGGQQAYHLPAVPAPTLALDYYFMPFLGISVGAEYSVALISEDKAGARYRTGSFGYFFGAKGRYIMSSGMSELTFGLAYAANNFKITPESGDQTPPQVAAVDYKQIRAGAGARIGISDKFALIGGGAYLHLLGIGELRDVYFPYATGRGGEGFAGIALGLPWAKGLEARLTADLRRYVFSMNSEQADDRIAGGATDQYVGANIAIGYRQ
jgi:hypothetical protein